MASDKIQASTRQLTARLNDILDMSKVEGGKVVISRERFDFVGRNAHIGKPFSPDDIRNRYGGTHGLNPDLTNPLFCA